MNISPDHKTHNYLVEEVEKYLSLQWDTVSAPYHDTYNLKIVERLRYIHEPTSFYIRARADRIAVHRTHNLVFQWEAKTRDRQDRSDVLLEALPLIHHMLDATVGVRCLYVYYDPYKDEHKGFWTSDVPRIAEIWIPSRWKGHQEDWFVSVFEMYLPDVPINRTDKTKGSGDPFVVIEEHDMMNQLHWNRYIADLVNEINRKQREGLS